MFSASGCIIGGFGGRGREAEGETGGEAEVEAEGMGMMQVGGFGGDGEGVEINEIFLLEANLSYVQDNIRGNA